MMALTGQRVFVAGGTGEVGEGIVRQFLHAGATVIVSSRSEERLSHLRDLLADAPVHNLDTLQGNIGTEAGAAQLADAIGKVQHVVAALGGWWQGTPLVDISVDQWHDLLDMGLTAHFIAAKTFLPRIRQQAGSTYTFINGGGGLHPVPTAGPVSVSAAGQMMLQRVFAAEHNDYPVRINTLLLATPVKTRSRGQTPAEWVSADDTGQYCVYLATTGTEDGEVIIFDDPANVPSIDES